MALWLVWFGGNVATFQVLIMLCVMVATMCRFDNICPDVFRYRLIMGEELGCACAINRLHMAPPIMDSSYWVINNGDVLNLCVLGTCVYV